MTYLLKEYIIPEKAFDKKIKQSVKKYHLKISRGKTFEQWLKGIDDNYVGKNVRKIAKLKKIKEVAGYIDFSKKNDYNRVGLAMLGIRSNEDIYLKRTNTVVKSVRIKKSGVIAENWSFPNFSVEDIKNQEWEESEVFLYLSEQRILMQIFVEEEEGYVYKGHLFLKFTPEELDMYVKETWEAFRKKVIHGIIFKVKAKKKGIRVYSDVQGKKAGQIGLIKLHAKGVTYDIDVGHICAVDKKAEKIVKDNTINGRFVWRPENRHMYGCVIENGDVIPKQSFWLNKDFVLKYIREKKPEIFKN